MPVLAPIAAAAGAVLVGAPVLTALASGPVTYLVLLSDSRPWLTGADGRDRTEGLSLTGAGEETCREK